jgi:uncharacterized protein (DUF342 family)
MDRGKIKLSYIAPQKRVRCEFSKQVCLDSPLPPDDIIDRAKAKLRSEKLAGEIAFFRIFKTRLFAVWQLLRESDEPSDTKVGVTIGSGAPLMPGLMITEARTKGELGRITIEATNDETMNWKPYFLKLTIGHCLRELGETRPANPAQITRIWFRALSRIPVVDLPLMPSPAARETDEAMPSYEIIEEDQCRDITLVVHDVHAISQAETWEQVKREIWERIDARNIHKTGSYQFLYDDLIRSLRSADRGPEHYGLDMPMVLLAAIDSKYYRGAAQRLQSPEEQTLNSTKASKADQRDKDLPQAAKARTSAVGSGELPAKREILPSLSIMVTPDKMKAVVKGFGVNGDRPQPNGVTFEWVNSQLAKHGFSPVATSESLAAIKEKLRESPGANSIIGLPVAVGQNPKGSSDPYLRMVQASGEKASSSGQSIDVRKTQRQSFVHKGELIAEVAYRHPENQGSNIYGKVLQPADSQLTMTAGEGVEEKSPGKFYATFDGQPHIEGEGISVVKGLVHTGDVNLATGNIIFIGPVQITGSVEAGASVEVSGDLDILGSVGSAEVYSQGNLTIAGGINTGAKGLVKVHGSISAKFVENSHVVCGANLVVTDVITNSDIDAQGDVSAKNIVGCELQLAGHLSCESLGKEGAKSTTVHLGGGKKAYARIQIQTTRLTRLSAAYEELLKQIALLEKKTELQKTDKHRESEEKLQLRAERLGKMVARVQNLLDGAKSQLLLGEKGTVRVTGVLAADTIIHIGRHKLRIVDSVAEVCVLLKSGGLRAVGLAEVDDAGDGANLGQE